MLTTILTFILVMAITMAVFIVVFSLHVLVEYRREEGRFPDWETFRREIGYWIN